MLVEGALFLIILRMFSLGVRASGKSFVSTKDVHDFTRFIDHIIQKIYKRLYKIDI